MYQHYFLPFMKDLKTYLIVLLAFGALFIGGCAKNSVAPSSSSLYVPTQDDATANATLQELQEGRQLYIDNCGRCHGLHNPDEYTPSQWSSILSSMVPRTSLSSSQADLVKAYVTRGQL